jgi:hypothetical protein
MSEAWVLELLTGVRDVARVNGLFRLAEQIDDAMLIAASEFHDAALEVESATDDREGAGSAGYAARAGLH